MYFQLYIKDLIEIFQIVSSFAGTQLGINKHYICRFCFEIHKENRLLTSYNLYSLDKTQI